MGGERRGNKQIRRRHYFCASSFPVFLLRKKGGEGFFERCFSAADTTVCCHVVKICISRSLSLPHYTCFFAYTNEELMQFKYAHANEFKSLPCTYLTLCASPRMEGKLGMMGGAHFFPNAAAACPKSRRRKEEQKRITSSAHIGKAAVGGTLSSPGPPPSVFSPLPLLPPSPSPSRTRTPERTYAPHSSPVQGVWCKTHLVAVGRGRHLRKQDRQEVIN